MIILYPDTNALHADLLMRRQTSRELVGLLEKGKIEARLSPVVVAEAQRQLRESAQKASGDIRAVIDSAARSFRIDDATTEPLVVNLDAQIVAEGERALKPLLDHDATTVVEWSAVTAQDLVARELERRPPVLEKSGQSVGLRDQVIWHGLLDLLRVLDDDDFVVFVCADGGFVTEGDLRDELRREIEKSTFFRPHQLHVSTSLVEATLEVRRLANMIDTRDDLLSEALVKFITDLDERDFTSSSSLRVRTRDARFPYGLDDPDLEGVDGIDIDYLGDGNPAECIGMADLIFRGRMSSYDYMDANDSGLEMIGAPGGNTVAVEYRVRAMIVTEIEYDLEERYASVGGASVSWRN